MNGLIALSALLAFVFPSPALCADLPSMRAADIPADMSVPPAPEAAPPADRYTKDWTVLIYVSARNNLGIEAIADVNEMEAAGTTGRVNVVAELGRIPGKPVFNPFASVQEEPPPQNDWTGSRRFLILKDSDPLLVTSPVLSHDPDADLGDWRRLADFIKWGKSNFPARRYLLIVGGHGSGWRGVKPPPRNKGISYDEVSKNHISPAELAQAIKAGGGVDVYASDACLMQTFEVIYDLRGAAEYVVGSQETTPGTGYNYELLLTRLDANPGDARTAADIVVDAFVDYYHGQKQRSVTMSIARPDRADALAAKLDAFARLVEASPADLKLFNQKKFGLRNFEDEDARDLYQLMKMYYENSATPAVGEAAREVILALAEGVVVRNEAKGYKSKEAWGMSIHFPYFQMNYKERYEYLTLSRDTRWDEMIKASVNAPK